MPAEQHGFVVIHDKTQFVLFSHTYF